MTHPILFGILHNQTPAVALRASDAIGELATLMPEIVALKGRQQPPQHHPEGDAFVHTLLVVDRAVEIGALPFEVWGALVHDLGKAVTPNDQLPHHYNHEALGVPLVRELGERLGVDEGWIKFGQLCAKEHLNIHKFLDLRPVKKVDLIERLGGCVEAVALVAQADAQGRGPTFINRDYPQRQAIVAAWRMIKGRGDIIGETPEKARIERAKMIEGRFGK